MNAGELHVALIEALHSKGRDALDRRMLNDQQVQLASALKAVSNARGVHPNADARERADANKWQARAAASLAACVRESRDVLRWYGGHA